MDGPLFFPGDLRKANRSSSTWSGSAKAEARRKCLTKHGCLGHVNHDAFMPCCLDAFSLPSCLAAFLPSFLSGCFLRNDSIF